MKFRLKELDGVLRGDATRLDALAQGEVPVGVRSLAPVLFALGGLYGLCMGSFGLIRVYAGEALREGAVADAWWQTLASMLKVPALFAATLLVTLPSLYVFNALVGSRLRARAVVRLLAAMLGVTLAVLASLGPIVAFFGLSTTSYPFMKLLNVVCFAVAGVLGLAFLLRTLQRLVIVQEPVAVHDPPAPIPPVHEAQPDEVTDETSEESPSKPGSYADTQAMLAAKAAEKSKRGDRYALELTGPQTDRRAKAVFRIWVVVFALVGAQMSWVLRPFIGAPELPFAWFRAREGNFFESVFESLIRLLGG